MDAPTRAAGSTAGINRSHVGVAVVERTAPAPTPDVFATAGLAIALTANAISTTRDRDTTRQPVLPHERRSGPAVDTAVPPPILTRDRRKPLPCVRRVRTP